jgi:hypothetical protein
MIGRKRGLATVTAIESREASNRSVIYRYRLRCDCGTDFIRRGQELSGTKIWMCQNCRCVYSTHPLYTCWKAMNDRCYNPGTTGYEYYGAKGVRVAKAWKWIPGNQLRSRQAFLQFVADMGPRPDGYTLDRIDPHGNYTPDNCRWATDGQQAANKRSASLKALARRVGFTEAPPRRPHKPVITALQQRYEPELIRPRRRQYMEAFNLWQQEYAAWRKRLLAVAGRKC